jgi:hypothetical protein
MAKEHRFFRRSARMHLSQSVIFGLSMRGMFQPIESHIRGKKSRTLPRLKILGMRGVQLLRS